MFTSALIGIIGGFNNGPPKHSRETDLRLLSAFDQEQDNTRKFRKKKTFQTKALHERVNDKNDKLIQLKYSTIDSIIIHFFQAHNCSHIRGSILSHEQTVCII